MNIRAIAFTEKGQGWQEKRGNSNPTINRFPSWERGSALP